MTATSTGSRIDIRKVRKEYAGTVALDSVDLDVSAGEFVTLLGASGSGKTTLLMILAGFVRPTHGSVMFGGQEVVDKAPHLRNIGMMFQNYALFPHMTVRQNIEFPLKLRGMSAADRSRRAAEVESMVALDGYGDRQIHQLSGGQRQRVALARSISYEPPILLMDEPLSALDKNLRESMQHELRRMHDQLGRTTIYVTHDQREALTISDRIAILDRGHIIQVDTPKNLYERPANRFVASFLGDASFLPVEIEAGGARLGSTLLRAENVPAIKGPAVLSVRPEKLTIVGGATSTDNLNIIPAVMKRIVYQGDTVQLNTVAEGGHPLAVRLPARADILSLIPETGAPFSLGLHPSDTLILEGDSV